MDLFAYTLNHRNTRFEILEAVLRAGAQPAVRSALVGSDWLESLCLTTCSRFEIYGVGRDSAAALRRGEAELEATLELRPGSLRGELLVDQESVRHVIGVTAGLDSILWGETSITAQVRVAYREAVDAGTCGPWLHRLLHHALRGARSIRLEAGVRPQFPSLSALAVASLPGDPPLSRLLVVGAGDAGGAVLRAAEQRGYVGPRLVSTQSDAADRVARQTGATAHTIEELPVLLSDADIVITASSNGQIISYETLSRARAGRANGRPLHIVDLGRPANVDRNAGDLPGVTRVGLDDLAGASRDQRESERGNDAGSTRPGVALPSIDRRTRQIALAVRERAAAEYEAWRLGRIGAFSARARASDAPADHTVQPQNARAADRPRGCVHLVGAGPGDPELLTCKARRLLEQADIVFYDALVPAEILDTIPRGVRRVPVGRRKGHVVCEQEDVHKGLIAWAQRGAVVVRLKGGDPMVFGRGGEEVQALHAAGIEVTVVPGVTAATAAAASVQAGLTHRGLASSCAFVTLHAAQSEDADAAWSDLVAIADAVHTLAIYMGGTRVGELGARLIAGGRNPMEPVALVERAQLPGERIRWTSLEELAEHGSRWEIARPALLLLGPSLSSSPRYVPHAIFVQEAVVR